VSVADPNGLPTSLGKWTVTRRLASRIDKVILLAEYRGQLAAVKILKNADLLDERDWERFEREVLNLQKIDHPRIPKIVDLDLSDAMQPWIATEFVDGPTLQERVAHQLMEPQEWLAALRETTEALACLHKLGIYHRDVSPSNIILSSDGAKLIDFGLAYLDESQTLTKTGVGIQGTPATVSPESLSLRRDPKMDMFSLGSTFLFAATGHFPFESDAAENNWMNRIVYDAPNFHGISEQLRQILTPLFYKDLNERISSESYGEALKVVDDLLRAPLAKTTIWKDLLKNSDHKLAASSMLTPNWKKRRRDVMRLLGTIGAACAATIFAFTVFESDTASNIDEIVPLTQATQPSDKPSERMKDELPGNSEFLVSDDYERCYSVAESRTGNVEAACLAAANMGDPKAIWFLGSHYQDNGSPADAARWFLKGARSEDYQSMLGLIQSYGKLGETEKRNKWLEICAKGFYGISSMSPKEPIARCKVLFALELQSAGELAKAKLYLKDAVSYGSAQAATYLGILYRDEGNEALSIKFYEEGVRLGDETALEELIRILDAKNDESAAIQWLTTAAMTGNERAKATLAARYLARKDLSSAKKWASECAKSGIGECNYIMGSLAQVEKNDAEVRRYFRAAHNQGIRDATLKLAGLLWIKDNDPSGARELLQSLVKKGDFQATAMSAGMDIDLRKFESACINAEIAVQLSSKLKEKGTWTAQDQTYLTASEDTLKQLCSQANKD
jgi:serine/threonine protein kinase/TPR repeat protein